MADTQQQIAELSKRIAALQTQMGELCGDVAELTVVMAPFIARYQQLIWPYYENLAKTQREIADIRVARGDRSAISAGEARSPLDRFFDDLSVEQQYERAWSKTSGKQDAAPGPAPNMSPVPDEIKQLYAEVVGFLHPELTEDPAERDRRRQLMSKADEAYIRRDGVSLEAIADMYRVRSNLPGRAPEDVVQHLRDRAIELEVAIGKIEGQKYDLRYGMMAKIKASAEQTWREQKRDLLTELSQEIQKSLEDARVELDQLRSEG